jgi:hypothetical protein
VGVAGLIVGCLMTAVDFVAAFKVLGVITGLLGGLIWVYEFLGHSANPVLPTPPRPDPYLEAALQDDAIQSADRALREVDQALRQRLNP